MKTMETFDLLSREKTEEDVSRLWEGLERLGVGLFRVNRAGYITRPNAIARDIFALDEGAEWEEYHISNVDRMLATGIAARLEDLFRSGAMFTRKNLSCTNKNGRFMVLDLTCLPLSSTEENDEEAELLGIVIDGTATQSTTDDMERVRHQLRILSEVAAALSSSSELGQILKIILTGATASQGLGFNRAFLFLYDESSNTLRGHLAVGPASAEEAGQIWASLDSMRLSLSELLDAHQNNASPDSETLTQLIKDLTIALSANSLVREVCQSGSWVNLEQVQEIDETTAIITRRLNTSQVALVPMVSKGKLMGLVAADNYITRRPISDEAVQLLQTLANQAAVAMERAKLYDVERERAQQLEQMNIQLAESQDQLIKIEKMSVIGELTSAVAHELRNPLTIIGGFANLLLKSNLDEEQREYLTIISSEIKRTESVVDHVLDFSRASKQENQTIELSELVKQSVELLQGRMLKRDVTMTLSLTHDPLPVYGNYDQLSHALYQTLKLVVEEVIPPGTAQVRTERKGEKALVLVNIVCPEETRPRTMKALQQIFTENKASQRLTVLVAMETIKYHGGDYGLACGSDGQPFLYLELPCQKEGSA